MSGGEIVVVKRGGGDGSRYPLPTGAATLGRGVSCDIRVLLSTVSDEQCVVTIHNNQALIRNLSDNNLTIVNGKPVQVKALDDRDVITIGDRSLRWEYYKKKRKTKTTNIMIPAGKIKFRKKKQTAIVASSRRSEVVTKRIDPHLKKILDLKTRASLGDMHGSPRQIAVVKPQCRSAQPPSEVPPGEAPQVVSPPGTPRRRGARGGEAEPLSAEIEDASRTQVVESKAEKRTSSECRPRLVTKPHRGKSNTPGIKTTRRSLKAVKTPAAAKSDPGSRVENTPRASQRTTKNVSTPILAQGTQSTTKSTPQVNKTIQNAQNTTPGFKNATPTVQKKTLATKATPKVAKVVFPKKSTTKNATPLLLKELKDIITPRRTPNIGATKLSQKRNTPTSVKRSNPQRANVEKIDDPVTIDANKKVALLLLTGRSPVKKSLPITETQTPEKAGSKRQTPAKAGSSKHNTPKFVIKRKSPIKVVTPKKSATPNHAKASVTPTRKKPDTPKGSDIPKTIQETVERKAIVTPKIFPSHVATKTPRGKAILKSPEAQPTPKTPSKGSETARKTFSRTSQEMTNNELRISIQELKTATPKNKNDSLADKSDVLESTPNVSARKSFRDSSGARKTVTPKSKNASLADESDVLESTPNVSTRKSIRDSSGGRKTATPKSKNVSLADESDVLESTPNVSTRKSIRDSSGGRKTATPKSKNASLANESDVLESTPNVSTRKSVRDSSGSRKTATPKSKNASLADESDVLESTPNVSTRKSIRDSSGGRKTATPKSKNVSLANESDVLESTPNVSNRKSIRDSSGARKTATPKSKHVRLADESDVLESTPNVSTKKSIRDSSGSRKTATPKSKNASLADESDVLESTPNVSNRKSIRDSSGGRKTTTPESKNASLVDEYDVLESTPNVSTRKSIRDSSGGRKTTTPKSKNASLADEYDVLESTPNVSTRKSIRDSSGGRKTTTPESKNASLADESDVLESTPNVSTKKSIRDSSGSRKTATPKSKNASLADESDVLESTPNVSTRKSIRDSSGGRKTATPKSKNVSLANESDVLESTPNVSNRKSIRDSSGGRKTTTPKSKNASLADESDVLESTPNVGAKKSIRDSSGGRKTTTPKSKNASLADESNVSESTPNVSTRKSLRDSSGERKTATSKSKNPSVVQDASETAPTISSAKKTIKSIVQQTPKSQLSPLPSGRKSALKSPNNGVRKNESIKFDLSNLDKSQDNDTSNRGRGTKRKSNNMTADSDIDLKLRFSDITEPSPKKSLTGNLNQEKGLILNETMDINGSIQPVQISRLSTKDITGVIGDSDLDESAETEYSHDLTRNNSNNRRRTRNSTIYIDTTEEHSEINTPNNTASKKRTRKSANVYAPDSYSIVDLVSDHSANNETLEKQTPGLKRMETLKPRLNRSKRLTLPLLAGGNVLNLKERKSLINNKFVQSVTSTPLKNSGSLNISLVDNITPVASFNISGKGPRLSVRSGKKTLTTSPKSVKKALLSSKSLGDVSDTENYNLGQNATPNVLTRKSVTLLNTSRKYLEKQTPSKLSVSHSGAAPESLYENISEASNSRRSKSLGTPTNVSIDKVSKNVRKSNKSQKSPSTPENKNPGEEATTPVLSVAALLNASKESFKRKSIRNTITQFESMSTPKTPITTHKDRMNKRKSELESLNDERKTKTDPRKVTRGLTKRNHRNMSLNLSAIKKISATVNRKNDQSSSEQDSVTSDSTDVNALQPENDIVITPKSTIKLVPEILKEKHSTAKKPLSRKSIIDHLNESQEMVKELFRSPVKRKLSQSMVQYSALEDSDDEFNESINQLNNSISVKPKNKRLSALAKQTPNKTPNVTFDFDSVKTPHVPTEMFVSPLEVSNIKRRSARNSLYDFVGVKKLFTRSTPKNDLTNVRGLKSLMRTPGARKSPKNDLTQVNSVKTLFASNKKKPKSPRNDLTKVQGVKKIFASPHLQKSPNNDLTNVAGVKKMLRTPIRQKSPHNDLTNIPNVRNLFSSLGRGRKSPRNDLTNVTGVTKIFRNPRSPMNALEDLSGVEDLFNSSISALIEGETSDFLFDKLLGKTPPKRTYQKSKSFVKDKEPRSTIRANTSMVPLEIIENHVEDWLEKELERRVRRDSEISNNEDVNTSQLQKNATTKLIKSSEKTPKKAIHELITPNPSSSRKSKVDRALSKLVIDAVDGDVEITPNRRARRLITEEKSNYSLEVSKAGPSKTNKSISKILLPLKKRSLSHNKFSRSTTQNRSRSQGTLDVSQSPNSRPNSRLSAHSEAELSLPLKKRTILKNDGALGHSTPVKKKLSPKKVQDSSIVDLGPVSPISNSLGDIPQKIASLEDSTAATRRGGHSRASAKNKSFAKVEPRTRSHRKNTANLSKGKSPKLVLEKKGTPKFSPKPTRGKRINLEINTKDISAHPSEEEVTKIDKSDSLKKNTSTLNVAKTIVTRTKRGQKNATAEIVDQTNSVSTLKLSRRGRLGNVESSLQTEENVLEVTSSIDKQVSNVNTENVTVTNAPVSPKGKTTRTRAAKNVASVDSPIPKSSRGRGKKNISVENETVDKSEEVVLEVKKPVRGRGKGNMTVETNEALEISVPESSKVSRGRQIKSKEDTSVENSPKPAAKRGRKVTTVEEITNKDDISVQESLKPAKRGRKAPNKVVEPIQENIDVQENPKPIAKRGRNAAVPKVVEEITNKEDISVQENPKPIAKRGRNAAVPKVVEEITNKEEISSPKPAPKRGRKALAPKDSEEVQTTKVESPKQAGRRKRGAAIVEDKETVSKEVKLSPPRKGRGRGKAVDNSTTADVSNTEDMLKPKGGRRKKEEPALSTRKVTFAAEVSTVDKTSNTSTDKGKPEPKVRTSRRKAAEEPEVGSEEAPSQDKPAPEVPNKRVRRGAEQITDNTSKVASEAPAKATRGKKAGKVVTPKKSPVAVSRTRSRQKK